jgi:hypothetical protein
LLYFATENVEADARSNLFFLTLSIVARYLFVQIVIARLAGVERAAVYSEESQNNLNQKAATKE